MVTRAREMEALAAEARPTSAALTAEQYQGALNVAGLEPDRRQRLLDHILRSNELQPDGPPVSSGIARCAAALLATDPERRVSAPTALAQAEALAELPGGGGLALIQQYESLQWLVELARCGWGGKGLHRGALRRALVYLTSEMQALLRSLAD